MGIFLLKAILACIIVSVYFFTLSGVAVGLEKPNLETFFMRIAGFFGLLTITLLGIGGLYLIFNHIPTA